MIAFKYPFMFLAAAPLLWIAIRNPYHWGSPGLGKTGLFSRLLKYPARFAPFLLIAALTLAAAGPERRVTIAGMAPVVDFAVVLDASSSMLAIDDWDENETGSANTSNRALRAIVLKESRWKAARRLLRQFISARPNDRFALVMFSAHPVTLSPLTADHRRLLYTLETLQLDSIDDGTAIGSALMTGVRRLSQSTARSRVILLLTDGMQNRGRVTPMDAALEAQLNGIRVHTVHLGRQGVESIYPIDGHYYRLSVDSDPETLKEIARLTGGEAFSADDPAGLERSLKAIDGLEKTALPIDAPWTGKPLALWFLIISAALALLTAIDLIKKRGASPPAWILEKGP